MRYYIIAGERSGDLHASNLVKAIRKLNPQAEFRGIGGDYLGEQGVNLLLHYDEMAVMGVIEVLTSLYRLARLLNNCVEDIVAYEPDGVILVDYGGFNRRVAKKCRLQGLSVYYYIPPKVWAWREDRAKGLVRDCRRLFVILPFEKAFYARYGFQVDYVGNPVLDAVRSFQVNPDFLTTNSLNAEKPIVALLPGSRRQEIKSIAPLMSKVAQAHPQYQFVVAGIGATHRDLYGELIGIPNVTLVLDQTYDILSVAQAAIVTSGTATLETTLFRVPQMVVYEMNSLSYWTVRMVIRVSFISLVNLIAGHEVVKELIHKDARLEKVNEELEKLFEEHYRSMMLQGYDEIISKLETAGSASQNTAKLLVEDVMED